MVDLGLFLSSELPNHQPIINLYPLFTLHVCDVVSSGGDVSMIYKEDLEYMKNELDLALHLVS